MICQRPCGRYSVRKMTSLFRRRRCLLLILGGLGTLFFVSLLTGGGSVGSNPTSGRHLAPGVGGAQYVDGPARGRAAGLEQLANGGFVLRGANSTGNGLAVQLWPKDSLDLVGRAYEKGHRKLELLGREAGATKPPGATVQPPVPISPDKVPCAPANIDCRRLRELLARWPSGKPKAAFYFLTQPSRLTYLQGALASVDEYFNARFRYPIIIFHEEDFIEFIPVVRGFTKSQLFFQEITFSLPSFLDKPVKVEIPCLSPIGYRHMCRFHAMGVFQQPIMRGLDYYWRLDDDSRLLRRIDYDVFQFMTDKGLVYGYSWLHWDNTLCTVGLWDAVRLYIKNTGLVPTFFDEWVEPRLYYNNFEISTTELWLSEEYAQFIEYIDKLGGIFYYRWGDAPIKGLAVSLFVPKSKVHHFKDIGYKHRSYTNL